MDACCQTEDFDENILDTIYEVKRRHLFCGYRKVSLLSDICLNSVCNNFPRFNAAFNTTEDTVLRTNLQFLQRVYTDTIFRRVMLDGKFDNGFDFLITEHLKELDIRMFAAVDYEKVIEKISKIGHGLVKVDLCSTLLNQSDVDRIVGLIPNVTVLQISGLCSKETVEIISSSCTKLEELCLENCFSDYHEATCLQLLSLPSLKTLSLTGSTVCESILGYLLDSLPNLEILHHSLLPKVLYEKHRHDLITNTLNQAKKYKLTMLNFSMFDFTTIDSQFLSFPPQTQLLTICLAVCPNLKTLALHIEDVDNEVDNLDQISQFSAIEDLTLCCSFQNTSIMNLDKFLISSGTKLKQLTVIAFELSINTLIQKCPNLEHARLDLTSFENESPVNANNCLNCLRELILEMLNFSDQSIETSVCSLLNSSPNLEKLLIAHSSFVASGMNDIVSNFCTTSNVLLNVEFINCDIEVALLESILLRCANLEYLVIDSCKNISSDVIDSLKQIAQCRQNTVEILWIKDELNSEMDIDPL